MTKNYSVFVCQQCGLESSKWLGKCTSCGSWGSLVETIVSTNSKLRVQSSRLKNFVNKPVSLFTVFSKRTNRISTKISELDRVLGGGVGQPNSNTGKKARYKK